MKIKLKSQDLQDILFENTYPYNYITEDGGVIERQFNGSIIGVAGCYKEICIENIRIGYGDIALKQEVELSFESDFETVEMHFLLVGSSMVSSDTPIQELNIEANQHNIFYANGFRGKANFWGNKGYKFFEINLVPQFFSKYLPNQGTQFYQFLKNIDNQISACIDSNNYYMTPKMHFIIREIIQCPYEGVFKKMFLEAKVLELLMLQLEQISKTPYTPGSISKSNREKIYAVKDILSKNLANHTTLNHLARQVGTNEFTLKKGFKEIFGTTVFGYWNELKMERAKHMLLHEDIPINRISEKIGYKNPQHFTTAFKKKYGIVPSELKKNKAG